MKRLFTSPRLTVAGAALVILLIPAVAAARGAVAPARAAEPLALHQSAFTAIRISNVSATPKNVSRFVAPKRTVIRYTLSAAGRVSARVSNSSGFVRQLLTRASQTAGTKSVSWTLQNYRGAWVGNGTYTIAISVIDRNGHAGTPNPAKVSVIVDNTAPTSSISAVWPASISSALVETEWITYRLDDNRATIPLQATLQILGPSGSVADSVPLPVVTQGQGRSCFWLGRLNGGATAPPGAYSARIRVTDKAGNVGVSKTAPVYVNGYGAARAVDATVYYDAVARSDTGADGLTHVVWNDLSAAGSIRYRQLDALGNTVVGPLVIASGAVLDSGHTRGYPDVGADAGGGAYVVWRGPGKSSSLRAIWLARINAAGAVAWEKRILDDTSSSYPFYDPRVSVGPDGVAHVVCWKSGLPSAVYYAAYRRDGQAAINWTALSTSTLVAQCKFANVQADSLGRVHVLWFDMVPASGTVAAHRELFYTRLNFSGGLVLPAGGGTIDHRRLTTTTKGYYPASSSAPEMAVDAGGALHVTWTDQAPAIGSNGIMYLKLASDGTVAVAPKRVFDCSSANTTRPGLSAGMPVIVADGLGARIVFRALVATSGDPARLWQLDVSAAGAAGKAFVVTRGKREDTLPSLSAGADGVARLVFMADTDGTQTSVQQNVVYKDLAADSTANDRTLSDLEVDAAHATIASTPSPPRQNSPVQITVDVRNAGWAASDGGTATLTYDSVIVDTVAIPPLAPEASTPVAFDWTVPADATVRPAQLVVNLTQAGGAAQTCAANDTTTVPVWFLTPPTETNILVGVSDETYDADRTGSGAAVGGATVTITGTTKIGDPYTATNATTDYWAEFLHVPLGTYTVTVAKSGYVASDPGGQVLTIATDPSDAYKLVITPSAAFDLWLNRWGTISGKVTQVDGTTAIAGATLKLVETGKTTTSAATTGLYAFNHLPEGTYTLKVTKPGFQRTYLTQVVLPATTHDLPVLLPAYGKGYLVGTITDEGGYAATNDPADTSDDPTITVHKAGDSVVWSSTLADATFDHELDAGSYTMDVSCPGYVAKTAIPVVIQAGVETDKTTALALDISNIKHIASAEKWCVGWTAHANWFGEQIPLTWIITEIEGESINAWWGMYRFSFDADYQTVGLNTYIRSVQGWFRGEYWNAAYLEGVVPPEAPATFVSSTNPDPPDSFDIWPISDRVSRQLAAVKIDQMDIIDGRDMSVVAHVKEQWTSPVEPDGHRYGQVGDVSSASPLPAYSHTVPWGDQIVRFWVTDGIEDAGQFTNAAFQSLGNFNQGELFEASGYYRQALYWDVSANTIWVEPALAEYPTIP